MTQWTPDFCPPGQTPAACMITPNAENNGIISYDVKCPYHASVQTLYGLTDHQLFVAVLQSGRAKETARAVAKDELGLGDEDPAIPYRVEDDGSFTLGIDQEGVTMQGWPAVGVARTGLLTAVLSTVLQIARPAGTSTISLAK